MVHPREVSKHLQMASYKLNCRLISRHTLLQHKRRRSNSREGMANECSSPGLVELEFTVLGLNIDGGRVD